MSDERVFAVGEGDVWVVRDWDGIALTREQAKVAIDAIKFAMGEYPPSWVYLEQKAQDVVDTLTEQLSMRDAGNATRAAGEGGG